jgi:predicted RNase H-like HicB family nuclease
MRLQLHVELEREPESKRWTADVTDLPGVLVYGATRNEALAKVKLLAFDVVSGLLARNEDPLTGCVSGEACPPFEVAARFDGLEFCDAVAC